MRAEMERLNTARTEVQRVATEGSRLEGELASAKKRDDELERQCQERFDCPSTGLGGLVTEFKGIYDTEVGKAETVLGIAGGIQEEDTDGFPI